MVEAAEKVSAANMIDFEFVEVEAWRQAKAILDGGEIGELRHVAVSWNVEAYAYKMDLNSWQATVEVSGGTDSFVSHAFHYLEWFFRPISRLSANLFNSLRDHRTADTLDVL